MIKDTTLKDETNVHDAMQFNIDSIYNPFNTEFGFRLLVLHLPLIDIACIAVLK